MWWGEALIGCAVVVPGSLVLSANVSWFPFWLALVITGWAIVTAALGPPARHRRWRWALHEEELDLLHGTWEETGTIVPVTRIQHVSVERTGWTNLFGLVRVQVHTAAGETTIPGLERPQADELRDRILSKLHTPDDL